MNILLVAVVALITIAFAAQVSQKVGVASPLILLALGIAIGFLPWVDPIELEPDLILEVIVPPLLFAAAVSMPIMDFRRELRLVAALAIGLVIISALVIGFVLNWLVPAISLPWAIALGAVLSPTDAVAVSIAKKQGVAPRIITILEGEGLFNDATALVLLSSATSAALLVDADALNPANLLSDFVIALLIAVAVGWVVGEVGIRVRSKIKQPAADTVFSFAMPFIASIPAEHLGGSGLVAAVVAGLIVSYNRNVRMPALNRRFSEQNWHTVELVLEGFVFLIMGIQAFGIFEKVEEGQIGVGYALLLALLLGLITVVVRTLFLAPLLAFLNHRQTHTRARMERDKERLRLHEERLAHACDVDPELLEARNMSPDQWNVAVERWHRKVERGWRQHRRRGNDLEYFNAQPLGVREGSILVWAGMRGAVTLAAAQTLPFATPMRNVLLLIALVVAGGSLALQGLTLPWVIRLVKPQMAADAVNEQEREHLLHVMHSSLKESALAEALHSSAFKTPMPFGGVIGATSLQANVTDGASETAPTGETDGRDLAPASSNSEMMPEQRALTIEQIRVLALEAIREQRQALLEARNEGVFSSDALETAMKRLDQEEIMLNIG